MKQDYIENQAKNQIQQSIKDALTGSSQKASPLPLHKRGDWELQESSNLRVNHLPMRRPVTTPSEGGKGGGFGKGPPGRSRSPGTTDHLFPEHPPDHCPANETHLKTNLKPIHNSITVRQCAEIHLNTESQIVIKTQFLQPFKFFIMKKQILFLAMFTLALIFAGTKSYGQTVQYTKNITGAGAIYCVPAVPLTCAAEDALHPLPGKTYTYSVNVNGGVPPAGTQIHWFVTDQATVIDGTGTAPVLQPLRDANPGNYILTATAGAYNAPGNTSASIDISWKSFNGTTNQVLLVAHVTDAAGCTNNVEVYRIEPSFAFTLDIAGILDDGGVGSSECVSPVESAVYTGGTDLTMNYGENWVYYSVNAANFVNSWQPTFTVISYTGGGGTAVVPASDIMWAYPANAKTNGATDWNAVTAPVLAQVAGGAVGATGECIVVRVRIDHANNENDAAAAVLTFGVDGIMFDPAPVSPITTYTNPTLKDLDNVATGPCTNTATDQATYTLTARPAITTTTGTPLLNFEPKL